jgi:hypothetical protein
VTAPRLLHLEQLHGRKVIDSEGAVAGCIHSVKAERVGKECLVREFLLGPAALWYRLGLSAAGLVGLAMGSGALRVPWEQLDLADPEHPRLRCTIAELKRLTR